MKIMEIIAEDKYDKQLSDIGAEPLDEIDWKQGVAAGAIALGTAMNPAYASDLTLTPKQQAAKITAEQIIEAARYFWQVYQMHERLATGSSNQNKELAVKEMIKKYGKIAQTLTWKQLDAIDQTDGEKFNKGRATARQQFAAYKDK